MLSSFQEAEIRAIKAQKHLKEIQKEVAQMSDADQIRNQFMRLHTLGGYRDETDNVEMEALNNRYIELTRTNLLSTLDSLRYGN